MKHRILAFVTVLVLIPFWHGMAGAQIDDSQIQVLSVVESDSGAVSLELAIPPAIGEVEPVRSNFAISFDGEAIPFSVSPVQQAVDVMVVVDTSGSMAGEAIQSAKSAAMTFIERLPAEARVGVIGFGETAELLAPISTDRSFASQAVQGLSARGETALWDALVLAGESLASASVDRPYVVVLSDGDDTVERSTLDDGVQALQGVSAGLYAISIQTGDSQPANLEDAVDAVGGQFLATADVGGLSSLYEQIADRLASRYTIEFQAPSPNEATLIVSVAVDTSIATARTVIGSGEAAVDVEPAAETPLILNADDDPVLAADLIGAAPGFFGGTTALILGVGAMAAALLLIGWNFAMPGIDVRAPVAAVGRAGSGARDANASITGAADRFVSSRDSDAALDGALDAAGINLRPGEFVLMTLVATIICGLFFAVIGGALAGVVGIVAAMIFLYLFVTIRMARQRKRFADQLPDALSILTGSLKAGRGLPQAIELVSQEAPSPMGDQFRRVVFETRVGRDMTDSIQTVADRMQNQDLHWVTRAIDINRELGGDLVEVLENVADTIRDRRRIARQVQALSAEGRASGWVLISLPFVMFGFLAWRTPENAELMLTHPTGRIMLAIALAGILGGYLWVRKLVDLKY